MRTKAGWLLVPAAVAVTLLVSFAGNSEPAAPDETPFDLPQAESPQPEPPPAPEEQLPEFIIIDVKGQVAAPGVYELPAGSRMKDAIAAAGGLLENAESRAVNLAMKLQDEMAVYIPETGEEEAAPLLETITQPAAAPSAEAGLVNINTATAAELETLPGIGPSKAAAIITHREKNGNFASIESLTDVTGIGDKTFESLKDAITAN